MATTPLPAQDAGVWHDHKRGWWLLGLVVPGLQFFAYGMLVGTGWSVFAWTGSIVLFGLVPVLDVLFGRDKSGPPDEAIASLEQDRYYRWCTYLYLPLQYAGLFLIFTVLADPTVGRWDKMGIAISLGLVSGIAINAAHELGHKKDEAERWLSKIALAPTLYGHFYVEHNRGHHVRVATAEDPASARLGEGFWTFLPRTVVGSLRSAWRIELKRMRRRELHWWSIQNDIVNAWLMSVLLVVALLAVHGTAVLPWFLLQAVVGFTLLESVNYLEHYGLLRQRMPDGRYERVRPEHSWNSDNITTNVLLYHLQRHSDHHANPTRRYQSLRSVEDSPELPAGYAALVLLAWVPPLWRRVMDPKVVAHYGGDVSRANLHPRRRAALLTRYASAGRDAA